MWRWRPTRASVPPVSHGVQSLRAPAASPDAGTAPAVIGGERIRCCHNGALPGRRGTASPHEEEAHHRRPSAADRCTCGRPRRRVLAAGRARRRQVVAAAAAQRLAVLLGAGSPAGRRGVVPGDLRRPAGRRARAVDLHAPVGRQLGRRPHPLAAPRHRPRRHRHRLAPGTARAAPGRPCGGDRGGLDRRGIPQPLDERRPRDVGVVQRARGRGAAPRGARTTRR